MRLGILLLVLATLCRPAAAQDRFPGAEWTYRSPKQSGWSVDALTQAQDLSVKTHATAVMIVHRGAVVAEWGNTAKRNELASVRKSLLSALIGIAVSQRKISLDSTLADLGIDDNPPSLSTLEKTATVRMLLQSRSGIYHRALYETSGMAATRPPRGSHAPGEYWHYNNWDFNALGTIFTQAMGIGVYDALDRLIAKPIGMQDYRPSDGTYVYGVDSNHRAYPIRMSARDLARFALLYLHNGNWAGEQLVPAAWVQESTRSYSDAGYGRGYGYLWWTAMGLYFPEGTFYAQGSGGQYAFVIPNRDLVVVHTVDRDRHLPEPGSRQVGEMLRAVLAAAPATQ